MREIRHRVQSCQIVACILPLVSGRSRCARCLFLSLSATSSRSSALIARTEGLAQRHYCSAIVIVDLAASDVSSRGDFHEEYLIRGNYFEIEGRRWRP